jgi:hypothetical protein
MGNFPIQGGCADLMRIAVCLATENGIPVYAPVHDAFLICSPVERIGADVAAMKEAMAEASLRLAVLSWGQMLRSLNTRSVTLISGVSSCGRPSTISWTPSMHRKIL